MEQESEAGAGADTGEPKPKKARKSQKKGHAGKAAAEKEEETQQKIEEEKPGAGTDEKKEESTKAGGSDYREDTMDADFQNKSSLKEAESMETTGDDDKAKADAGDEEKESNDWKKYCQWPRSDIFPWLSSGNQTIGEVWTCGLVHPDHVPKKGDEDYREAASLNGIARKLTKHMQSWAPANCEPSCWEAFFVAPATLKHYDINPDKLKLEEAVRHFLGLPQSSDIKVEDKARGHDMKTYWPAHFYFDRGVHTNHLARIEEATSQIQDQTIEDSVKLFKFQEPSGTYAKGIVVVGEAKQLHGGLFVAIYADGSEEHIHQGK